MGGELLEDIKSLYCHEPLFDGGPSGMKLKLYRRGLAVM